jgi:Domain of unknown function (DUF4332)
MNSSPLKSPLVPQSWDIGQIPGLSLQDREGLMQCGIQTTLQLFEQAGTIAQKQSLATQLQVHIQHVNRWFALADLARIPDVGCQYCGLLLHAGISSPDQLAKTSLPRLHRQVLKLQVAMLQRQDLCPTLGDVNRWIQQARQLGVAKKQNL